APPRIPLLSGPFVTAIEQGRGALAVTMGRLDGRSIGPTRRFVADVVCLGYGFQPANELLRALGATHDYDPGRGQLVTRREADGATTVPGVYAVGDCCGLGGAQAAAEEGTIAGLAVARSLGLPGPARVGAVERAAR